MSINFETDLWQNCEILKYTFFAPYSFDHNHHHPLFSPDTSTLRQNPVTNCVFIFVLLVPSRFRAIFNRPLIQNIARSKIQFQIEKFKLGLSNIEIGIDHKEYSHSTKLTDSNIKSLSADFN